MECHNEMGDILITDEIYEVNLSVEPTSEDDNDDVVDNYQKVIPTLNFANDVLKKPLENIVYAFAENSVNYPQIKQVVELFSELLKFGYAEEPNEDGKSFAKNLQNKKKHKVGNKYSLYVMTDRVTNIRNTFFRMYGNIRCASYRFNKVGEYGIIYSFNKTDLEGKISDGIWQNRNLKSENQQHLKLSFDALFSDTIIGGPQQQTIYYRAYYKLKNKNGDIYLKFPSSDNPDVAFGKIRSFTYDRRDLPKIFTIKFKHDVIYTSQTSSTETIGNSTENVTFDISKQYPANYKSIEANVISHSDFGCCPNKQHFPEKHSLKSLKVTYYRSDALPSELVVKIYAEAETLCYDLGYIDPNGMDKTWCSDDGECYWFYIASKLEGNDVVFYVRSFHNEYHHTAGSIMIQGLDDINLSWSW